RQREGEEVLSYHTNLISDDPSVHAHISISNLQQRLHLLNLPKNALPGSTADGTPHLNAALKVKDLHDVLVEFGTERPEPVEAQLINTGEAFFLGETDGGAGAVVRF